MHALVVYESMFGNTRTIAESIAGALRRTGATITLETAAKAPTDTSQFDVIFVGAPTHAHTLPQPSSRTEAAAWADQTERALVLEPAAKGPGVREWLKALGRVAGRPRAAAFATRVDIPRIFSGDASGLIARRLKSAGIADVERECFIVSSVNVLLDGEAARAAEWARERAADWAAPKEGS